MKQSRLIQSMLKGWPKYNDQYVFKNCCRDERDDTAGKCRGKSVVSHGNVPECSDAVVEQISDENACHHQSTVAYVFLSPLLSSGNSDSQFIKESCGKCNEREGNDEASGNTYDFSKASGEPCKNRNTYSSKQHIDEGGCESASAAKNDSRHRNDKGLKRHRHAPRQRYVKLTYYCYYCREKCYEAEVQGFCVSHDVSPLHFDIRTEININFLNANVNP